MVKIAWLVKWYDEYNEWQLIDKEPEWGSFYDLKQIVYFEVDNEE